jgi:hypothetical protein
VCFMPLLVQSPSFNHLNNTWRITNYVTAHYEILKTKETNRKKWNINLRKNETQISFPFHQEYNFAVYFSVTGIFIFLTYADMWNILQNIVRVNLSSQ